MPYQLLLLCSLGFLCLSHFFILSHAKSEVPEKEEIGETGEKGDEAVVSLTKDTFDKFVTDNEVVLVEFYAPWCGHCKKLTPEYEEAAKALAAKGSAVRLAKVDATQEADLADKFGVRGYPTLELFRKQKPEPYSGGRTADTLVDWLTKMTGPAVEHVEEAPKKDLAAVMFVGRFKGKDSALLEHLTTTADANRQMGKFIAHVDASHSDEIVVIRGDEEEVKFTGSTEEELKKFVNEESFALFGPINGENFKSYAERSQELIWFCGETKEMDDVKLPVREAAKKYRADYSFVWLDTEQFKGHAENALGVTEFPALVYQSKKGRYLLPDNAMLKDGAKLIQFIEDVKAGKIEKSLKSEPIPEKNDEPVKVVVGKTFEELVLSKEKDVLLEVYAPWCGHCKKLEPVFTELAETLSGVDSVVIAKMDGTANEAPVDDFDWTGFPTLFFVKAGSKSAMKFDGGRTLEGMLEYIKKHSSTPITDDLIKKEKKEAAPEKVEKEEL